MHLNCEDLACARVCSRVCWQEDHFLARLHDALLDTSCEDITDAFDLVDTGDRHAHWTTRGARWHTEELVEAIVQRVDVDSLLLIGNIHTLPPIHVCRLL